ncbi:hypothetical protein VP01_414g1 [Puccinia sorghi]|uniref:Uncharacterized protein n=1 Tax=Puccinia sorghi TaxID=27349 RepID=A0A0L6UR08_9BASI|nr:hypothetical protein VP01_414g1 [Puccinia sorghi]
MTNYAVFQVHLNNGKICGYLLKKYYLGSTKNFHENVSQIQHLKEPKRPKPVGVYSMDTLIKKSKLLLTKIYIQTIEKIKADSWKPYPYISFTTNVWTLKRIKQHSWQYLKGYLILLLISASSTLRQNRPCQPLVHLKRTRKIMSFQCP